MSISSHNSTDSIDMITSTKFQHPFSSWWYPPLSLLFLVLFTNHSVHRWMQRPGTNNWFLISGADSCDRPLQSSHDPRDECKATAFWRLRHLMQIPQPLNNQERSRYIPIQWRLYSHSHTALIVTKSTLSAGCFDDEPVLIATTVIQYTHTRSNTYQY
jgi:hypothetical protein